MHIKTNKTLSVIIDSIKPTVPRASPKLTVHFVEAL